MSLPCSNDNSLTQETDVPPMDITEAVFLLVTSIIVGLTLALMLNLVILASRYVVLYMSLLVWNFMSWDVEELKSSVELVFEVIADLMGTVVPLGFVAIGMAELVAQQGYSHLLCNAVALACFLLTVYYGCRREGRLLGLTIRHGRLDAWEEPKRDRGTVKEEC